MESILALFASLNGLSPLAIIGLLGVVIYQLVMSKSQVATIQENHLHDLPTIAADVRSMVETLQRMEVSMSENFSHIKARINGKH